MIVVAIIFYSHARNFFLSQLQRYKNLVKLTCINNKNNKTFFNFWIGKQVDDFTKKFLFIVQRQLELILSFFFALNNLLVPKQFRSTCHTALELSDRFNSLNQHFWAQNIKIYHKIILYAQQQLPAPIFRCYKNKNNV